MDDQFYRPGARVIVCAPQGSAYDGKTGTIRRIYGRTAFVAFVGRPVLTPFGLRELLPLSATTR